MDTALLIEVPEAEPLVGRWRAAHDPSSALGVPAHVTLVFPFVDRERLDGDVASRVAAAIERSGVAPFDVRFERPGRFPGVVYLEPAPAEPFLRLIGAVVDAFPDHPPYGGAFETVVPHLTVADDPEADLDAIEASVRPGLPIVAPVRQVALMAAAPAGWTTLERFPLVSRGA
ncbi:MAG TPA: 2'-5' RNA ligase family protein [Actinomycetota bacterium]|nr:2'-5' RNA ligase family protein [Actinomycetota bacterium]